MTTLYKGGCFNCGFASLVATPSLRARSRRTVIVSMPIQYSEPVSLFLSLLFMWLLAAASQSARLNQSIFPQPMLDNDTQWGGGGRRGGRGARAGAGGGGGPGGN